jgi:hypothetical protein
MAILITAASFSLAYKLERLLNESEVYFADQIKMPAIPAHIAPTIIPQKSATKTCKIGGKFVIYIPAKADASAAEIN